MNDVIKPGERKFLRNLGFILLALLMVWLITMPYHSIWAYWFKGLYTPIGMSADEVPFADTSYTLGSSANLTFDEDTGSLQVSGANVTRGYTLFVASANASTAEKAQADYLCDGEDDDVEINAAIAAMPDPIATGTVGTVKLSSADFCIGANIIIDKNMVLEGPGVPYSFYGGSQQGIWREAGYTGDMIVIQCADGEDFNYLVCIRNLGLDGNGTASGVGIRIDLNGGASGPSDMLIQNCFIHDINTAIKFYTGWHARIHNNWIENIGSDGINGRYVSVNKAAENEIIGNIIDTSSNAINIGADGSNSNINWTSTRISDNYIGTSGHGILLCGCIDTIITNNTFWSKQNNTKYAIQIGGTATYPTSGVTITDNVFTDGGFHSYLTGAYQWKGCIYYGSGAYGDGILISNNNLYNCSAPFITDGGATLTDEHVYENIGYVTENSGTTTITNGNASVDVVHGLDITPDEEKIVITPMEDMDTVGSNGFYIPNTANTTHFQIYSSGNVTDDMSLGWSYRDDY